MQGDTTEGNLTLQRRALWIMVALILAPAMTRLSADPDLWGNTRFGLDILESWTLPSVDPYSFTQDIPWVNHEWLSELTTGVAYRVAGNAGLIILKTLLVSAFAAVVVSAYAGTSPVIAGLAFFLSAWGTAFLTGTLRPQLWTLLGVALLCRVLTTAPRPWWLVGVPLTFAVWVNMHGGWIVGAGLLAVWTVFNFFKAGAPRGLIVGVAVLSAVATLVNPYGWHMWEFLFETVRFSRSIGDWQPLFSLHIANWLPWIATVTVVVLCVVSKHRPPIDRLAMMALLIYASLRVSRIAPLSVAAATVLMQPTLTAIAGEGSLKLTPISRSAVRGVFAGLLCLAAVSAAVVTRMAQCIPINGVWAPDLAAGRTLAEANLRGTIVTWFNWGHYSIWHLGPELRVSMDGRRETIYSAPLLANHFAMYEGRPEGLAFLDQLNADYVWLPAGATVVRDWLMRNGYRVDIETRESFIAVRSNRPKLNAVDASSACFPGP